MKILMLGWELPPYNSGGLGVACFELARALASEGADIQFVLPSTAPVTSLDFMTVHQPTPLVPGPPATAAQAYGSDFDNLSIVQKQYQAFVESLVHEGQPDVIHAHDWLTLEAGVKAKQLSGAPLIAHVHATEFDRAGDGVGNPLIHEIEQHGLLMADHIVAVSHATKQLIIDRYDIPADKIEVIHNGSRELPAHTADMVRYKYIEHLKREGYVVVASVGRLTLQKGLTYFLQAAALAHKRYERMVFLIAGDGDQRDELIAQSADLGIADAVLFTGFVRGKAWRDIYSLADIFVMSSVSEPFGLSALEAAQNSTAISLTNQSGVREVLHNVLTYDYWDTERLADQLISLALSEPLRHELSSNAELEVNRLSWEHVANQFTRRYHALGGIAL